MEISSKGPASDVPRYISKWVSLLALSVQVNTTFPFWATAFTLEGAAGLVAPLASTTLKLGENSEPQPSGSEYRALYVPTGALNILSVLTKVLSLTRYHS